MPIRLTPAEASRTLKRKPADLAGRLAWQLELADIRGWVREHRFHPSRMWRIDIAFPDIKLAVECEGMGPKGEPGRHQLTQHIASNTEKHSALAVLGWRLIRVTGRQIDSGHAIRWIGGALAGQHDTLFLEPGRWAPLRKPRRRRRLAS